MFPIARTALRRHPIGMSDVVLLLSTFPNVNAARAAVRTLVEERLAACGNIAPGIESIYRWKGEIETGAEVLVICKTTAARADDAQARLRKLHPYEVPEVLRVPVTDGWPDYLAWVRESVGEPPST
jgi:periplasmic divalent cation tolerance protein